MKDLDELLDTIAMLKDKRDSMVAMFDMQIDTLSASLEKEMIMEGMNKFKTESASAGWRKQKKVVVGNWMNVMQYIMDNDAFDILQKRIAPSQLEARLNAGAVIDGVSVTEEEVFVITKRKEKNETVRIS